MMPKSGRATVLVIDDEPRVLEVIEIMLVRAGFAVVTAGDAEAALRQFAAGVPIRVALCDVKLPGMNGYELAARIREISPGTRIILTSGFAEEEAIPGVPFLPKPFSTWQLLNAVEAALESRPPRLAAAR